MDPDLRAVLAHYPSDCRPIDGEITSLGAAGGFSGARFWRFASPRGPICVRRWPPEHPTVERLQFIQAVLWHVHQEGFHLVPLPLEATRHAGFVEQSGHLWELAPWMPGQADYHEHPSPRRLQSALTALAEFHQAAASFPLPDAAPAASPGIRQRWEQFQELQRGLERLRSSIEPAIWPELAQRASRLLELFPAAAPRVATTLTRALEERVPLSPCIRDIWHDHVLFDGDSVSALIDFGALRPESVAGDVSRLLGSLVADDPEGWRLGVDAYEQVRPLSAAERRLIKAFDQTSVLLSGFNWLQWVFLEGRQFDARETVVARVDATLERLARLA